MKPGDMVSVVAEVVSANDLSNVVLKAGRTHFTLPAEAITLPGGQGTVSAAVPGAVASAPAPKRRKRR